MNDPTDNSPPTQAPFFYARIALHIFALSGFAIAQPVLSVLASSTELFVARRTAAVELVVLSLALIIVPPALLIAVVWLAGRFGNQWAWRVGLGILWLLLAMLALQVIAKIGEPPWPLAVLAAALIASGALALYVRFSTVREYATILAVAPLVFVGLFLFGSGASRFVLPSAPVGAVEVGTSTDAPVVFLILDEFPLTSLLDESGRIDAGRYPNLAELAADSYWFEYPVAAHVYTTRSFAGLMSGSYSRDGALPTAEDYPNNLFTLMGATHEMHVYEPETEFCPDTICEIVSVGRSTTAELKGLARTSVEIEKRVLLPQLFDESVLSLDDPFGVFASEDADEESGDEFADRVDSQIAADQVALWRDWLTELDGGMQQFHFRHVFLPHAPYKYLPDGTQYNRQSQVIPALDDDGYWTGDAWHTIDAQQRQLLQIQAVDALVGELTDRLTELGVYDETMIVLTSDHGVSHVPDDARRDFTPGTAAHVGFVPLIMKAPRQVDGVVWSTPISGIDLVPTMADMLDIEVPWETEGRSVLAEPRSEALLQTQAGDLEVVDTNSLDGAVAFVRDRFPPLPGEFDIYAYSAFGKLLGSQAADLAIEPSDLVGVIDDAALYENVETGSGFTPVFVGGSVSGDADALRDGLAAVIVNGAVASIVPVYEVENRTARFGAVVPPSFLVDGANDVALALVSGNEEAPRVLEVQVASDSEYTLRTDANSYSIANGDGAVLAIDEAIRGYVDSGGRNDGRVHFSGWALDEATESPAQTVIVFVDGLYVGGTTPDGDRQALAVDLGSPGYRYSGFSLNLAGATVPPDSAVRVFALANGRVHELEFLDDAREAVANGS